MNYLKYIVSIEVGVAGRRVFNKLGGYNVKCWLGELGVARRKSFEQIASIEGLSLTFIIIKST